MVGTMLVLVVLAVGVLVRRPPSPSGSSAAPLGSGSVREIQAPVSRQGALLDDTWRESSVAGATPRVDASLIPLLARNAAVVAQVRGESLEQSIAGLVWLEMYPHAYPSLEPVMGPGGEEKAGPFFDQRTLNSILGNRRFLRVSAQLSALPRAEAGAVLNGSLKSALADYAARYDDCLERFKRIDRAHFQQTGYHHGPISAGSDDPRRERPTLEGLRYRVLGLVLVGGNLGLDGAKPAFDEVLSLALSQRRHLRETTDLSPFVRLFWAGANSCYNPCVLATGISAACGDLAKFRSTCEKLGIEEVTRKVTGFDAEIATGETDIPPMGVPADFSKGEMQIRFYDVTSDEQFDALLKELDYQVGAQGGKADP
jgi:hypothetical protein